MDRSQPEDKENLRESFELQQEMMAKPEWKRIRRLSRLGDSVSIFAKNHSELQKLLDYISISPEGIELFFEDNRPLWEQAMHELARLVHNYVAAGVSVVDHAKTLHGGLHKECGAFVDFTSEVDARFFRNSVAAFMRELRNHFMHIGTPAVGTRMHYTKGAPAIERKITMPKSAFRTNRWEPEAKSFLAGITADHIDVSLVVEEYRLVVEQFFEWMYGRLREIHKPDFQVVAGYQREIFKLRKGEFESSIRHRLKLSKKGIGSIVDVLSPFLTIADTSDMASLVKTPKAWVEEAVRRIEMFVQLPASLKVELTAGL